MKVIFFGTPKFAVPFLRHLEADKGINLQAVVTQPDKPVGRKKEIIPSPVKEFAVKKEIAVLQPENVKKNPDFTNKLKELKPDFLVVVAYGAILPPEILKIPKYDCINVHGSLLPKYRGASPVQSALLNGETETGVSFISLNEKMDAGDLYLIKKIPIELSDTQERLLEKLSDTGATLLPSVLRDIKNEVLTPIPQNDSVATYCSKISKEDAQINPQNNTAEEIKNKFRAFYPWPGVYMIFKNKRLKLLDVKIHEGNEKIKAGSFLALNNKVLFGTKKGILEIEKLQPEGKNPLSAKEFINGFLT